MEAGAALFPSAPKAASASDGFKLALCRNLQRAGLSIALVCEGALKIWRAVGCTD